MGVHNDIIERFKLFPCAVIFVLVFVGCGGGDGANSLPEDSALLSWSAPLTRENGQAIAMGELDRYVIRFGQDVGDLARVITLSGASDEPEMSYAIYNLGAGTWYFTVQVQDTAGLISKPSNMVSKTIGPSVP